MSLATLRGHSLYFMSVCHRIHCCSPADRESDFSFCKDVSLQCILSPTSSRFGCTDAPRSLFAVMIRVWHREAERPEMLRVCSRAERVVCKLRARGILQLFVYCMFEAQARFAVYCGGLRGLHRGFSLRKFFHGKGFAPMCSHLPSPALHSSIPSSCPMVCYRFNDCASFATLGYISSRPRATESVADRRAFHSVSLRRSRGIRTPSQILLAAPPTRASARCPVP